MIKYIVLGIIQGFTEFFPVSSSGHLAIVEKLFGIAEGAVAITVIMHLGTILALVIFFFKDILKLLRDLKLIGYVLLVTVITGIIGIAGKDFFEGVFKSPRMVAVSLVVTGIILLLTKKFPVSKRNTLNIRDAFTLGIAQSIAIIPGISRSGTTVSCLLFRKLDWETSFRFSFIASIPAVLGAALLEAKDINFSLQADGGNLAVGFIFSFLSGFFALRLLKGIMAKAKWHYFGYYCLGAGVFTLIFIH
ncbi:MAG: undecaprenyl-diphosphate phosphatase [Candidatus Omnitrophota bacterium]|jgi:undecaprenyl-diphosphatase